MNHGHSDGKRRCFKASSAGRASWKDGVVTGRVRNSSGREKKRSEPINGKCWCSCAQERQQGILHVAAVRDDTSSYFMYLFFRRVDEIASV